MIEITLFIVIIYASCTWGVSPTRFEFERGSEGIVVCPDMVDNGYLADNTEAIYWFFCPKGSSDSPKSIITYFHGVTTQNSNREQYKIQNSSLVISIVTQSDEGTYSYRYIPWYKLPHRGSVEVSEIVSYKARLPKVSGCSEDQPSCKIEVPSHTTYLNLTCTIEHFKPAVNISWFRMCLCTNTWEEIHATHQFELATCNASETECFYVSDTFNSYATVLISLESINSTFMCGRNNKTLGNTTVTVIKAGSDLVTGVINPTGFGFPEITSMMTTSEPLICSEGPGLWVYAVVSVLFVCNILYAWAMMKRLSFYRKRLLHMNVMTTNVNINVMNSAEEIEVCKV